MKDFTPSQRNSIYVEVIMQEDPKINSVLDLYNFLQREKGRIWKILLHGDQLDRHKLIPELKDINQEMSDIENHFTTIIKQQDN